jgi:hypothetical protein
VDPDGQCDANDWTRCAGVLGPHQCDINRRDYSPYCIDGEWFCLPGMIDDFECNCWGEAPEGKRCSESGWTPIEDGAGGATP